MQRPALVLILLMLASATRGEAPSDAAVDEEIRKGVTAPRERVQVVAHVKYRTQSDGRTRVTDVRGRVTRRNSDGVWLTVADGRELSIRADDIVFIEQGATIEPDYPPPNNGGSLVLVAFALLTAGVDAHDASLAAMLETLEKHPMPGTYGRGLRAAVWARRAGDAADPKLRARYRRLLKDDVTWLTSAMKPDGMYSYDRAGSHTDHSVTQFANLGVWAAADALNELPAAYWTAVEKHWLASQRGDGGWTYESREQKSRASMTVAGANSLYLVLDQRYPRMERPYVRFRGATMPDVVRSGRASIYTALARADEYLSRNAPAMGENDGYNLFGLERLGVASGRASIGQREWYRGHAVALLGRVWGENAVADAFSIIFLVHGRAPVWIQKLEYGDDPEQWNRYGRDMHFVLRFLSKTFEKPYRWQIVRADAGVESLRDAPILYIAGSRPLALPAATLEAIEDYIRGGGSVFLHADAASVAFTDSARRTFESMFAAQGRQFHELPPDHPVFKCYFGRGRAEWPDRPRLLGLGDGRREFVLLSPVDLAGAWQQNLTRRQADLFELMVNVRTYLAPRYEKLPPRIRANLAARETK